jgi:hypothetical protein
LLNAPPYAKLAFNFLSGELDPRITFSRTSNATLVGSDGSLQYAPHNLLTYSEQFDNAAWNSSAGARTVTANTVAAPDGTTTADTITADGTSAAHFASQAVTLSAVAHTYSVYVKKGTNDFAQLRGFSGFGGMYANFDVANGVVGSVGTVTGATPTASIQDVGNGWYRCTMVFTPSAASSSVAVYVVSSANSGGGEVNTLTTSIYVWGAQLNVGALQPYYQTEASAYYGPRFDYDPVTLAPKGLLIEEQRTNLAINSGDVLSGGTGGVVVANQITAPDGSLADFFQEDTSSLEHYAGDRTPSVTAGTTYTWSFYAKLGLTGEARRVCVRTGGQGPGNVVFDLETGGSTVLAPVVSSGISSAGNGWFRCWIVYTATGTGAAVFRQQLAKGTNTVYTGDGTSGLFFWGAQLEVGAFPTSYIPTTTAAATRAADVASVTGANFSNWYNPVEGTFYTEFSHFRPGGFPAIASINNGSLSDRINLIAAGGSLFRGSVVTAGVSQADMSTGTYTINSIGKIAVATKANDFALAASNGAIQTDTSGTMPTVDRLQLGFQSGGLDVLNGHIRSFKYYPTRLSNGQLQTLTK